MKKVILRTLLTLAALVAIFVGVNLKASLHYLGFNTSIKKTTEQSISKQDYSKIVAKAKELFTYAKAQGYDTSVFFIINMEENSGKPRFFVYDWNLQKITKSKLVAHGRCNETALKGRKYSNVVGGGCTSLGRYKVANPYQGKFGLAYKLFGLDSSNSNAFERFVVLHSHECVPNSSVDPYPICQSDGCPTVSPQFINELATIIDQRKLAVLLEIFDDKNQ